MSFFSRRYLISLFYLLVVTVGVASWLHIPLELSPDVQLPSITVTHRWGSTAPEVVEQEVTRKVEQVASQLRDVEKIQSVTREGSSSVTVTFRRGAPVDFRSLEMQEYLFGISDALPQSLVQMPISRSVPREISQMQTFMVYSMHGDVPQRTLLEIAERSVKLPLMGLDGLAEIDLQGVREPALTIVFNTELLGQLGLRSSDVLASVRRGMSWHSAGFTEETDGRYSLMVPPQVRHIEDIERIPIALRESQRTLQLSDVARVELRDYPERSRRRVNGSPALNIRFEKEGGADALKLASEIITRMEAIKADLPETVTLRLEQDNTERLRRQLSELQTQSLFSVGAVFLVLLLFIRRFRAPFIILGSIVFSILISVSLLLLTGYTINLLTLAGITVAIGMIIDNAVVVFEFVNPALPTSRKERLQHIRNQLPRSVVPVLGSTLTTIGIFLPLLFAMEANRILLVPLALSLSFTLLASVLVSLTWIPYALIWLVGASPRTRDRDATVKSRWKNGPLVSIGQRLRGHLRRVSLLRILAVRRKLRWVLTFALIAAIGIPTFTITEPAWSENSWLQTVTAPYFKHKRVVDPWIGGITHAFFSKTFFGEPWGGRESEQIFVSINTPQGTPLEEIDKIARNFEAMASPYREALEYYETSVSEQFGARIVFHINTDYLLKPEPYILYAEAAYLAARTGNARISVSGLGEFFGTGGGGSTQGRIQLSGYSYTELEETALRMQSRLEQNRRVQNVDINQTGFWGRNDLQQYHLVLDEALIVQKGLQRSSVLEALQVDINPENIAGRIEFQGQRMYLMGLGERTNQYWMDFQNRPRQYGDIQFTIGEIAELDRRRILNEIRREDQSYSRAIAYEFLGPGPMSETFRKEILESFPFPIGVRVIDQSFWGFGQTQQRLDMIWVLLMALVSVWMIVSALLEKWGDPLVVILAVPLALLGVMSGVLFHGLSFAMGAIAGTLLSTGVVVNNAILLIHEKQRYRELGIWGLRSWVYVYRHRFRAILITSLTTIAGLLPMILYGTDPMWTHLAIVVSWGLGFSTVLLLLFAGIWGR